MANVNKFFKAIYKRSPSIIKNFITSVYAKKRAKKKYGAKFYEYLLGLQKTQWLSEQEILTLQNIKLQKLINYAVQYVPFYKDLYAKKGISSEQIKNVSDLKLLPLLEKEMARKNNKRLLSELHLNSSQLEHFQTSGTTGKPLEIYASPDYLMLEKAFKWNHRSWGGLKLGDATAAFVGHSIVPIKKTSPPFWIYDNSENRTFFSVYHMSKENMKHYKEHLKKIKPASISGYPMAIYILSKYLLDSGKHSIKPKAVFTHSETLIPYQREVIEKAFGCKVLDWYGQTEFTANIVQCEKGNYHVKSEYGVVEIINRKGFPAKPGEVGEIVATGLNNFAMPFIRYRTGDTAIPKKGNCPCGKAGPLVSQITGRVEDIIVTPEGRLLSRLDYIFKGVKNIIEAQLVQEDINHLVLRIVKSSDFRKVDKKILSSNIKEYLGDSINVEIKEVEKIPLSSSGKFKYVISKVPIDFLNEQNQV